MDLVVWKLTGRKRGRWLVPEGKDLHTEFGMLPADRLSPGLFEHDGERYAVFPAVFADRRRKMKRGAQIITPKDLGYIIARCGLGSGSVAVEAGSGSGGATVLLARVCDRVESYEIRADHLRIAKENVERLGLTNVEFHEGDFTQVRDGHDADLVLLDLPEPWAATEAALSAAKPGGFVVAYTPTILQAQRFVTDLPERLVHEETLELIDRRWKVHGQAVRPGNAPMGHTAFLTFCRVV